MVRIDIQIHLSGAGEGELLQKIGHIQQKGSVFKIKRKHET